MKKDLKNFKYINIDQLEHKYKFDEYLTVGKSGSSVVLVSNRKTDKKYILKYDKGNKFKNEILINLELITRIDKKKKFFPLVHDYGYLKIKSREYYFYITDHIDGCSLKDLYTRYPDEITNLSKLKKLFYTFIKLYANANKKIGLIHYDIKGDNIFYDKRNKQLILIDFGNSETDSVKLSLKRRILKKKIEAPLKRSFFPESEIEGRSFNKTPSQILWSKNKIYNSFDKISSKYIDIINLLKLINTGIRMLFKDNKQNDQQIYITDKIADYINSDTAFYDKLLYILKIPFFH